MFSDPQETTPLKRSMNQDFVGGRGGVRLMLGPLSVERRERSDILSGDIVVFG